MTRDPQSVPPVEGLADEAGQLVESVRNLRLPDTPPDAREQFIQRHHVKRLHEAATALKTLTENLHKRETARLAERMEDEKESIRRFDDLGITFQRKQPTIYASVQKDKLDEFVAWARENDPDLIDETPSPRKAELNALARECIDDKRPPPPGVTWYPKPVVEERA